MLDQPINCAKAQPKSRQNRDTRRPVRNRRKPPATPWHFVCHTHLPKSTSLCSCQSTTPKTTIKQLLA